MHVLYTTQTVKANENLTTIGEQQAMGERGEGVGDEGGNYYFM